MKSIVKELDLAIKLAETKTTDGAYLIEHNKKTLHKETYMSNAEWETFLANMSRSALAEYSNGNGGELESKDGRPPKMASYGSSSRLIYNLSRNKEGFHFEKKLPTTVGGTANLDGFFEDATRQTFVEAKCHEPYSAKNVSVSNSYRKLYEFINDQMAGELQIEMATSTCGRYMDVKFFADCEEIRHFDLKQMICHLLGIATGVIKGTLENKQIDFIYLLYDPSELPLPPEVKDDIIAIYEKTCYECNLIDFASLLRVIFVFLNTEKFENTLSDDEIENIVFKFTFSLASQEFYPLLLG